MNSVSGAHLSYAEGVVVGGKYRLERLIGEGGMAKVWRATDMTLRRPVALKFVHVFGDDETRAREQFLREARAAAAVRHRNVVDIIDFGTADDGRPYMVMEHLEGESLAERMQDAAPLPIDQTARILADALSGLAAVHDAGLVHRDLKPENIFLVRDADGEYAKLLDFGVSRSVWNRTVQSVVRTMDDVIAGTPEYMAPEHARGEADVDHRADVYSVGVVLYEALTGRVPFDGETSGEIIVALLTTEPTPPRLLRPQMSDAIESVIARAMSRDRNERFQTARELRNALVDAVEWPGGVVPFIAHSVAPPSMGANGASLRRSAPTTLRPGGWLASFGRKRLGVLAGLLVGLVLVGWAMRSSSESSSEPHMTTVRATSLPRSNPNSASRTPAVANEPQTSVVELTNVPRGAVVYVDGVAHKGARIELDRSERVHDIRVSLGAHEWRVRHRALRGAVYAVDSLHAPPLEAPPERVSKQTTSVGRSAPAKNEAPVPAEGSIFTDPGF